MRRKTLFLSTLLLTLNVCLFPCLYAQTTRYVAQEASGSGSSWANASGDLQAMIEASAEGDIILVKEGLYKPAAEVPNLITVGGSFNSEQRAYKLRAFYLKKGVKIYGGCKGTESGPADRQVIIDPLNTILSGSDKALAIASEPNSRSTDGTHSERCAYHVIIGLGDMSGTVLDGFTIQNGKSYRGSENKTARAVINDRNNTPYDVYYLSGGGLYLSNMPNTGSTPQPTSITLNNLTIRNCNSIGETTYTPTAIGQEQSKGSGLYADNVNITFEDLSVEGCVARSGGGIYAVNASHLTGTNLICRGNNSATGYGNGVFIENIETVTLTKLTIDGNKINGSTSGGIGGGMYNKDIQTLTLNGECTISNNNATASAGGMHNENIGTFNVNGPLTVSGNEASTYGGGIYFYNIDLIHVPDLTVTNNAAKGGNGGGIYIENTSTLSEFRTLTLTGNSATMNGGGICLKGIWKETSFLVKDFICTNNTTGTHGGGIYTERIDVIKFEKLTLDGNKTTTSGGCGGGMYTRGPVVPPSRVANRDDLISGNENIYATDLPDDYITLVEINELVSCKNNTAYANGGGFYTHYVKKFEFIKNVSAGTITGNRASNGDGGAFYNEEVGNFKTDALVIGGGNSAGRNGAGMYCYATHIAIPDLEIGDGITANTASANGGGAYWTNTTLNDFERLVLKKNTATNTHGGGLYLNGNNWTQDLITNTFVVDGNTAGSCGGGIYTTGVDRIKITDLTLTNNSTTGSTGTSHGGGIYTVGSPSRPVSLIHIHKVTACDNNVAKANGGAFYSQYVNEIRFTSSVDLLISNNNAYNGGAMYNENITNLFLPSTSVFDGNSATTQDGGALYNKDMPEFSAENIVLKNNLAARTGGAVYFTAITGDITIDNLTMNDNKVTRGSGAGMYFTGVRGNITVHALFAEGNQIVNDPGNDTTPGGATFCFVSNGVANEMTSIRLENGVIKDSYARSFGGGIYISAGTNMTNNLELYNMEFNNCRTINVGSTTANAREDGGAIFIHSEGTRTGKINAYFTDIHIHNCFTARDGTVYFGRSTNDVVITTDKFDYNRIENNCSRRDAPGFKVWHIQGEALIENTSFDGNIGGPFAEVAAFGYGNGISCTGGGLYTRQVKGIVRNCKFMNNKIHNGGSGFYCAESQVTLSDLLFEGNYAGTAGAGFYADAGTQAQSMYGGKNLIFRNNEAKNGGGAMYFSRGTIHFVNVYCIGNKAGTNGGVVHADNSDTKLYFYNAYFIGNRAETKGGAVYTSSSCRNHVFVNAQFTGNYSGTGQGSAIYYADASLGDNTFINCTFANNFANTSITNSHYYSQPINVEAQYVSKGTFYNCIFYNNKYQGGVRDYFIRGTDSNNRVTFTNCHFTSDASYDPSLSNVTYTNITTGDPVFVDPVDATFAPTSAGDYRLDRELSPCVDMGNNELFNAEYNARWTALVDKLDLDNADRIQAFRGSEPIIDLGPFEGPGNASPRTCLWYGTTSTDWNVSENWLNNLVPDNGDHIGFHPEAIRDLLVPDKYKDGSKTEITVGNIYNIYSSRNLVLNQNKLNVEGIMDFNAHQNHIDARQLNSELHLNGTSEVNQDLTEKVLANNAVYNLSLHRTLLSGSPETADVKATKLRILNKLSVTGDGKLYVSAANSKVTYGVDATDPGNTDYSGYPGKEEENIQYIDNHQFRNESVYELEVDNAKGVHIRNGQGDTDNKVLNVLYDLTINPAAKMVVEPAAGVIVDQRVHNHAGVDGLLIRTGTGTVDGKLTQTAPTGAFKFYNPASYPVSGSVEFFLKGYYDAAGVDGYKYKWQYFTLPVREIPAVPTFGPTAIRKWNERQDHTGGTPYWEEISASSTLYSFDGYEITANNSMVLTISGILENRDYKNTLTYSPYNEDNHPGWHNGEITDQDPHEGEHIIGNPYTAPLEIENMNFGNNIEKTVYIFNTGSFMDWHYEGRGSGNYDYLGNPGQYIVIPQNLAGKQVNGNNGPITLPSRIPPMQAFSVMRLNDGGTDADNTFTLTYASAEVGDKNDTHLRSAKEQQEDIYTFISMESDHYRDFVWLSVHPGCRKGFDNGWDGRKAVGMSAAAQLFTIEGEKGETFQISSMDNLHDTYLGFRAAEKDTEYTLTFTHTNLNLAYKQLTLTDLWENKTEDITPSGSTYTFSANNVKDIAKRFRISAVGINETSLLENKQDKEEEITIYVRQNEIIIKHPGLRQGNAYVYDTTGRCLIVQPLDANENTTLQATSLHKGVYIINIVSGTKKTNKSIIL